MAEKKDRIFWTVREAELEQENAMLKRELEYHQHLEQVKDEQVVSIVKPPKTISIESLTTTLRLAAYGERTISADHMGYHVFAHEMWGQKRVGYYVTNMELIQNRYDVAEIMRRLMWTTTVRLIDEFKS